MDIDWKDALQSLKDSGELPADEAVEESEQEAPVRSSISKEKLQIVIEKKGRRGKTATIVTGFTCNDETLQETAQLLKKKIGTGGSARGGEILIQGDFRQKVEEILLSLGYRI